MQAKAHRRRFSQETPASFNAGSSYRALQSRIASEPEAKARKEFMALERPLQGWESLYQYIQQGLLPSYKLGRHRLFRKEELLATLGANRTASRTEILR